MVFNHALSSLLNARGADEGDKNNLDPAASSKHSQPSRKGKCCPDGSVFLQNIDFISDWVWSWSEKQLLVVKSTVLEISKS